VLDLQAFQGQTIKLRFVTHNTGNSHYRLDNVYLQPLSTTTYTVVETNPPNYTSSTPDTVTVDAYGGAPLRVDFGDFSVDRYNSTVAASPTEIVADGVSASEITVILRDGAGNPLSGHLVEINAPGLAVTVTQPTAPTDALGRATGYVRSTYAPQSVQVTGRTISDNVTLAQAVPITFTPGLPDPDRSTFVVSPASVVANGTDAAAFIVTLRDQFGNLVAGKTVTVTVEGTAVAVTLDAAQTDALGQVSGAVRSSVAQTATLHARDVTDDVTLTQSPVVLFTSTDPQRSSVVAAPGTLLADGVAAATITVTLRAQNDEPLPGKPVVLDVAGDEAYVDGQLATGSVPVGFSVPDGLVTATASCWTPRPRSSLPSARQTPPPRNSRRIGRRLSPTAWRTPP
jgi:adhesin/invasin